MFMKFLFLFFFGAVLLIVGFLVSKKSMKDEMKLSPFECGFNNRLNSRMPFSLQFFLVSVIFVIFDMELILLFPYLSLSGMFWSFFHGVLFMVFLFLLTGGLLMEWNQQTLNWVI